MASVRGESCFVLVFLGRKREDDGGRTSQWLLRLGAGARLKEGDTSTTREVKAYDQ